MLERTAVGDFLRANGWEVDQARSGGKRFTLAWSNKAIFVAYAAQFRGGGELKAWLNLHGETQRDFAKRVRVTPGMMSHLILGRSSPGGDLALRIEEATDGAIKSDRWPQGTRANLCVWK